MRRGKVELKRIENKASRQLTFSKRRKGLFKKAEALAVLCDVDVGVIVFSEHGELFDYSSPASSLVDLIHRYEAATNTHQEAHHTDHHQQQMAAEISKLRHEYQRLEASLKTYTGEDLSSLTSMVELDELEQQLESAVSKVRARKDELFINLTEELQLKINEHGRRLGAATASVAVEAEETMTMAEPPLPQSPSFAYLLAVEEKLAASSMLRLWPPTDEDADDGGSSSSSRRGLQLW